jgi:hypothetical protein
VQLLVFTAVALCAMVFAYGLGLGGSVSTLIFLAILFGGVMLRVTRPLLDRLRP